MRYEVEFRPQARRELAALSPDVSHRVMKKIEALRNGLAGDVKRLVHYRPEYRLRVGDWRVLFELAGPVIRVWSVVHRSEAYE
jgi:mRNA interferase RelE/StbE